MSFVFGVKGRAGDKGDTGEQGEPGVQGEQGEQGVPGDFNYTDRGDISDHDFDLATIVANGNWHSLSLSSIVGTGHRLVLISVLCEAATYGNLIEFRTCGNTKAFNTARLMTLVAEQMHIADLWVWTSKFGTVDYRCDDTAWDSIEFTVRGWVEPTT
ncbi:unnamed protein product [marine sediment metagenome]|uniref:Uncharacterized protein n=1 Tax=marine sediment metagenome TaxID=412755 RepID=X1RM45_9ZZZZ